MENFVHDFPFTTNFEQRKEVCEAMARPVVEFQAYRSNGACEINTGNPALKVSGWTILIIPIEELLDRPGKKLRTDIAKDCCFGMEGRLHVSAFAWLAAIDVDLDRFSDRIILT